MTFIFLPDVGTLTLDITNFVTANPALIHQIAGDALSHALHSYVGRSRKRRGMTRRQMRKNANRKRRWFVDNIIMHHKRLHDRNRAIVVSNARTRALAKRDSVKKDSPAPARTHLQTLQREREMPKQNSSNLRERAKSLRGRVDSRRLRARSRWLSVMTAEATAS